MVASSMRPMTVSRTSSTSSLDFVSNNFNPTEARRTRKRISAAQLAQLEELYQQSSHPTRDQRDSLAKRIQMETKSVTIWFQNKRQTDRKVALHNATNSRNLTLTESSSRAPPDITLTTPTSPAYPQPRNECEGTYRSFNEGISHCQFPTCPLPLHRTASFTPSVKSISTASSTSTSKTRVSLDCIASRTEIRFTDRQPLTRSCSSSLIRPNSSTGVARTNCSSAPPRLTSQATPVSPPPSAPPIYETMLSSPLAPSSPPPPEYIEYTRTRKARTLDWACAAARLFASESALSSRSESATSLPDCASSFSKTEKSAARARDYEEATSLTEDEADLVTPHGSQDTSLPWCLPNETNAKSSKCPPYVMDMDVTHGTQRVDIADNLLIVSRGWEDHEMRAALALCGLRG